MSVESSEVCVVLRGGAHSAAPTTPITIAHTATYSIRPGRSWSRCSEITSSTTSPAASAGCTTTSGASMSATTCSGKPRIVSPVPISQRVLRTSRTASANRRFSSSGVSRASIA